MCGESVVFQANEGKSVLFFLHFETAIPVSQMEIQKQKSSTYLGYLPSCNRVFYLEGGKKIIISKKYLLKADLMISVFSAVLSFPEWKYNVNIYIYVCI